MYESIVLKLFVASILGILIGLERELTQKWAGIKTHALVCVGSCVFTILSIYGFTSFNSGTVSVDPTRIAAQILTGIGFIGGGTVLKHGSSIYGLTTAATLWIAGSIGMAVGCGHYSLAVYTSISAIIILVVVAKIEKTTIKKFIKRTKIFKITVTCHNSVMQGIIDWFYSNFTKILTLTVTNDNDNVEINLTLEINNRAPLEFASKKLKNLKNYSSLHIDEFAHKL